MSDSEYDQRQYGLMLERLDAFERGDIRMYRLIDDLDGLFHAVKKVDRVWEKAFLELWGTWRSSEHWRWSRAPEC
jgi:hypothetical protein